MTSFDSFSIDGDATTLGYSAAGTPPYEEVRVEHVSHTVNDNPDPDGFGSDSHTYHSDSFEVPISSGNNSKPYDLDEDSEGIFSSIQEEGFALREWRRQNAVRLEENEKREKESRNNTIEEGGMFKKAFYEKRSVNIETNKTTNREKENLYVTNQERFHKEADKQYWKAITELIPKEVANIEKKARKKDEEKKPSIIVVQGPKPGKPTDLSRMRHLLVKLKHNPPPHMLPPPPAPAKDEKDVKDAEIGKNVHTKDVDAPASDSSVVHRTSEEPASTVNDQHAT